jgi:glycosyltransferase involved in cell wall biosynthesis
MAMDFTIVTPSLNMLPFLKCCAASIADQQRVRTEHIVVDAMSNDGTVEWLKQNPHITRISEHDRGMYDALNKGLRLAKCDILAYLNCDEQYLPDTLAFVKHFFACNPAADILFGDFLVTKPEGTLIAYRKAFKPRVSYLFASYLYTFTCTMFFRRRIIDDGFWFNPELRLAGDAEWLLRVLGSGYLARHQPRYFSVFVDSGLNASKGKDALAAARKEYCGAMPAWLHVSRQFFNFLRFMEKTLRGNYWQTSPLEYDIYTMDNLAQRTHFSPQKRTFRWRNG